MFNYFVTMKGWIIKNKSIVRSFCSIWASQILFDIRNFLDRWRGSKKEHIQYMIYCIRYAAYRFVIFWAKYQSNIKTEKYTSISNQMEYQSLQFTSMSLISCFHVFVWFELKHSIKVKSVITIIQKTSLWGFLFSFHSKAPSKSFRLRFLKDEIVFRRFQYSTIISHK